MFKFGCDNSALLSSKLYNQDLFYPAFSNDMNKCRDELIIESPFLTNKRIVTLLPIFQKLLNRGVKIYINTRPPEEHDAYMLTQAREGLTALQNLGVKILFTGGHHRKLAIIDKRILWEGSLNILSQCESCEFMRRIESEILTKQMLRFLNIERFLR